MFFCFTLLCTHSLHVETVDHRRVFQLYPCECQSIFSSISVAYCSSDITILALIRNRLGCLFLCFFHLTKRKYRTTGMSSWMQIAENVKKYTHKTWLMVFSHMVWNSKHQKKSLSFYIPFRDVFSSRGPVFNIQLSNQMCPLGADGLFFI